jgi:hypothetical protein
MLVLFFILLPVKVIAVPAESETVNALATKIWKEGAMVAVAAVV